MDVLTNGPTNGLTDGWTDRPSYKDASTHLKCDGRKKDLRGFKLGCCLAMIWGVSWGKKYVINTLVIGEIR